jgi:hypothetical protein
MRFRRPQAASFVTRAFASIASRLAFRDDA